MLKPSTKAPDNGDNKETTAGSGRNAAPTISLAKGGGAIRGIGEKFVANPVTGTGSLNVPIFFSPSRSSFSPQLSLSYDSGAGNGPFGIGWGVSVPALIRKTDKGLPRYQDENDSDTFLLSESEDLVPALISNNGSWSKDSFDIPIDGVSYTVQRYRPRVEGSFARIEKILVQGEAGFYWKITSKENVVTIFGRTAASRIADPGDPSRIYKWLADWSYDDKGNCLEYAYKAENQDEVPLVLNERNRLSGLAPVTNQYLKQVSYGNKNPYYPDPANPYKADRPANPAYFFATLFDYGEHDEPVSAPIEIKPWRYRFDPFSDYRAGFEIRTQRLCRRILTFHFFTELNVPPSPAPEPYLVRSLDLSYRHFKFDNSAFINQEADFITAIKQVSYKKTGANAYQAKSLPAIELSYHELEWNKEVKTISPAELVNAPTGIGTNYQWADLLNEGVSGILSEQANGWYYKSNLGGGRFSIARQVTPKPSFVGVATGSLQFQDLDANGTKQLVVNEPGLRGYFELDDVDRWSELRYFDRVPNVNFNDPNTRYIDLNNDGKPELVVSEENALTWFPSLGTKGFDAPELSPKPFDEEHGPAVLFADETQSVYIADMSGDGLADIVRIRNGEVCYWPNLGYGKFGAKVSMKDAPVFDYPDQFNPSYLHLADVSGTGATDILYLGQNKFKAWLNLSGNALSAVQEIDPFPTTELPNQLSVIDLLGNGTACIVWSSSLSQYAGAPMRYVDLMGGKKPYILSGYKNNLGHETRIEYQSSASYYLKDKQEGQPWVTKLPFPVQCVSKVEIRDQVSDLYFVNEYRYHHGFYDHAEREFRGFGMVEQLDTQTFANFRKSSAANIVSEPLHQPPMLTKTWFHTGAFIRKESILRQFEHEYYRNTAFAEHHLPDAEIEADELTPDELRQAYRACKGMTLRQEVYAPDGSPRAAHPYSAAEHNCHIRLLQPLGGNRHAVFTVHESEAITYQYEREPSDPRIAHTLNTLLDEYSNVLEAAAVVYGRVAPDTTIMPVEIQNEIQEAQAKPHITYTRNSFTNDVTTAAAYRLRLPCEVQTFELTGAQPAASYFTPAEIRSKFLNATLIDYEAQPTVGDLQIRLIEHERTLFAKDSDVNLPLALGVLESLGLKYESYKLAFTPTLLTQVYGTRVDDTLLAEGKYIKSDDYKANGRFPAADPDGYWWIPSGIAQYPPNPAAHFYLPDRYLDPFGAMTKIKFYSDYHLLIEETEDPLANKTTVQNFDFRLLQPQSVKDPNDNITELSFDIFGLVVGTAIKGKGNEADDLVGFSPDLTQAEIDSFFSDPLALGAALLQHASSRFVYDLAATPAYAASITRETHHQDFVTSGTPSNLQFAFEYSDGSGQVVMKKVQAEPGLAKLGQPQSDGSYVITEIDTTPNLRWVGNGRTILNNKGKAVMQYEPYFSVTHHYESAPELVEIGVTPVLYYDPVGRLIKTDSPNGTFSRVEFDAWLQRTFDQNDTVLASDWYAARIGGVMGLAEQDAAQKAALHNDTPTVAHLDSLGRLFCTVAHNKFRDHTTNLIREEFYATLLDLDIENNQRAVTDARGREILTQDFSMLSTMAHSLSVDAGERWLLNNVAGNPIRSWDSRNHTIRTSYDSLRRPTHLFVQEGTNAEVLAERTIYGEALPNGVTLNLRGKVYQHYDGAGLITNQRHDFKGNLLSHTRQLAVEYKQQVEWSVLTTLTDAQAIASPPTALLESEIFATSTEFDALNRPTKLTTPDLSEIRPGYNEASLLERVDANLRGDTQATGFVTGINYDAKGQRIEIVYGNGATTAYEYDEKTFRLTHLSTIRTSDSAQLQDLFYTYDPVGNITTIEDRAQKTVYFNNQVVTASAAYDYDATYRLIEATGREHLGQTGSALNAPRQPTDDDSFRTNLPHPSDGNAMGNYTERYDYDEVGNILKMIHAALSGSWTRRYDYDPNSNRLLLTSNPSGSLTDVYDHDAHGNMIIMPHLPLMQWDYRDQLHASSRQVITNGTPETTWYAYDSGGQRVRKVTDNSAATGQTPTRKAERLYLGGFEIYREYGLGGSTVTLERETLHIMDDKQRIALVETKTEDVSVLANTLPVSLTRYQFGNYLGSASLELDHQAQIISYEEYFPYGSTSYQAARNQTETPKRYRYTGKERDEENDLSYHGARYYAPWLGRWTAADPASLSAEMSAYQYGRCNPVHFTDPTGQYEEPVHGALTYQLALAAGFKEADAAHIALATAGVDHNPATMPLGGFLQSTTAMHAVDKTTAYYHFPSFANAKSRVNTQIDKGKGMNLSDFGVAMHALQDVGFSNAPGPHLRQTSVPEKIVLMEGVRMQANFGYGVGIDLGYLSPVSITLPHLAKLFGTPDSQHQSIGIGHPEYITETGKQSNAGNKVADQAFNDPVANTKELTQIYDLLKQAAKAYYGNDSLKADDAAAAKAIAAVTSANTEAKVLDFVNRGSTFSGTAVNSYSYWVGHNTFTKPTWSASGIDNSILDPKSQPLPKYLRTPDGMLLNTETNKVIWGPGPKF